MDGCNFRCCIVDEFYRNQFLDCYGLEKFWLGNFKYPIPPKATEAVL